MILDGPLNRPQKVVRFRLALSQAQDPAVRASAMKALAKFVNVRDAVAAGEGQRQDSCGRPGAIAIRASPKSASSGATIRSRS